MAGIFNLLGDAGKSLMGLVGGMQANDPWAGLRKTGPIAPPVHSAGKPGFGDFMGRLGPAIMMMDPLGRNNEAASAMMRMNEARAADNKQDQHRQQTQQWLQSQGLDSGAAQYLSGDPQALQAWFMGRKAGQP